MESIDDTSIQFGFLDAKILATPETVSLVQSRASDFLKSYRDGGAGYIPIGPQARLQRSLSLTAGVDIPDSEIDMWLEQLALDPWARGHIWRDEHSPEGLNKFSVIVIGAGMGGLNAAVQLQHAGIPFTLLEKNSGVGGTW